MRAPKQGAGREGEIREMSVPDTSISTRPQSAPVPSSAQPATPPETSLRGPDFLTKGLAWHRDFDWRWNGLYVRKTGAWVPFDRHILDEVVSWFRYYFAVAGLKPLGPRFSYACEPERLRPWYLLWPALKAAGGVQIENAAEADLVVHFEDSTLSPNQAPQRLKPGARTLNFACPDVSKTKVAEAFEAAFGYSLSVDPLAHQGPAVEKSEFNGVHDGRIVECPTAPKPGCVYQRLVDAHWEEPDIVADLRTPTIGGEPILVFVKKRPVSRRFSNDNSGCDLLRVEDAFSAEERAQLSDFTRRIGLDWGGLDVLRDKRDGRLYIVDANKTDMGPPIALPQSDKMRATRLLAQAVRSFMTSDGAT